MQIGQLATKTGLAIETIRFYETAKLMPVAKRNPANNYRIYDNSHLRRLFFLKNCRSLGMTLDEIRSLLNSFNNAEDCNLINQVVAKHLEHVQKKLKQLIELEARLKQLNSKCASNQQPQDCGILRELYDIYCLDDKAVNIHDAEVCVN